MTDEEINVSANIFALEMCAVDRIVHLFKSGVCDGRLVGGMDGTTEVCQRFACGGRTLS